MRRVIWTILILSALFTTSVLSATELPGKYKIVAGKTSSHTKGVVKIRIFMDFFCSHCYKFDTIVVEMLQKSYGNKIKVEYVGFPLWEYSVPPIEAYEMAMDKGKGPEMRVALFRAIHEKRQQAEKTELLAGIAEKIGMSGKEMAEGLGAHIKADKIASNVKWGKSFGVRSTPTIILDNNIKIEDNSHENVDAIISAILDND